MERKKSDMSKSLRPGKDDPRTMSSALNPSVHSCSCRTWGQHSSRVHTLQVHSSVCLITRRQSADASRHIVVLIWTVFVSFHIVSVYK